MVRGQIPVDIGRDDARDAAAAELAKPEYQAAKPGLVEEGLRWLGERLADFFDGAASVVPGGPLGWIVLIALVVVVVVVVRLRVGKMARGARRAGKVFEDRSRSAAEYRLAAEEAVTRGELDVAVRERFRAIVRGLEERGVLDERPGRTADEAAVDAGRALPVHRQELGEAAALFDAVHYGGQTATGEGYRKLVALDDSCQGTRV